MCNWRKLNGLDLRNLSLVSRTRCHVIVDGSIFNRANASISSSVKELPSVLSIPNFFSLFIWMGENFRTPFTYIITVIQNWNLHLETLCLYLDVINNYGSIWLDLRVQYRKLLTRLHLRGYCHFILKITIPNFSTKSEYTFWDESNFKKSSSKSNKLPMLVYMKNLHKFHEHIICKTFWLEFSL